jgi:hypothetical protein
MVFAEVLAQNTFVLAVPAKIIYDDHSAYRFVHIRGVLHHRRLHQNPGGDGEIGDEMGKKWTKRESQYPTKLQK